MSNDYLVVAPEGEGWTRGELEPARILAKTHGIEDAHDWIENHCEWDMVEIVDLTDGGLVVEIAKFHWTGNGRWIFRDARSECFKQWLRDRTREAWNAT